MVPARLRDLDEADARLAQVAGPSSIAGRTCLAGRRGRHTRRALAAARARCRAMPARGPASGRRARRFWMTPSTCSGAPAVLARSRFISWIRSSWRRCKAEAALGRRFGMTPVSLTRVPWIVGRHERGAVVDRAAEIGRRIDGDVAGQILVLGAQAIEQPGAHRRPGELRQRGAGVKLDDGLRMGRRIGVQAAEEAELVHVLGEVRQEVGDPGAGLAVPGEAEFGRGQGGAAGGDALVIAPAAAACTRRCPSATWRLP